MENPVCVVVVKHDVVDEIFLCDGEEAAGEKFLDECSTRISNWDEYSDGDIDTVIMDGYEKFENGSICISHPTIEEN